MTHVWVYKIRYKTCHKPCKKKSTFADTWADMIFFIKQSSIQNANFYVTLLRAQNSVNTLMQINLIHYVTCVTCYYILVIDLNSLGFATKIVWWWGVKHTQIVNFLDSNLHLLPQHHICHQLLLFVMLPRLCERIRQV